MRKTNNYELALYDKEDKMAITAEEDSLNHNMEIIDEILGEKPSMQDVVDFAEANKEMLKGEDGKSAYEIWLEQGNTGTEQDFLDSLKGEKGDPGNSGSGADIDYIYETEEIIGFEIRDKNNNAGVRVRSDGTFEAAKFAVESLDVKTMNVGEALEVDNIEVQNDEKRDDDLIISDKNGGISLILKDGKLYVTEVNANKIYGEVDFSNNKAILDIINSQNKPKNGNLDAEINMFICYGQSWSTGYDAKAISTEQKYDNLMLNTGVMNNPLNDMSTEGVTHFVPLVEFSGKGSNEGYQQTTGETPVAGQTDMVKQLLLQENKLGINDIKYQLLGTAPGIGSKQIEELAKGTIYYTRLIEQVEKAYNIARSMNKKLVVQAFSWVQGSSVVDDAHYFDMLEQLRTDIDTDVKAITGQTQTVKCITWQAFLYTKGLARRFYERYVYASEKYENIICSGASYHFDNIKEDGTNLHLTSECQAWLGAYFGIAYKRSIIDGEKFIPLKPISCKYENITNGDVTKGVLYVKFHVPCVPLRFDTDRVWEAPNYGFNIQNSSKVEKVIESVEIVSADTVKIICSEALVDTDRLTYSQNAEDIVYSRKYGNRGNLRDSQGDYITYHAQGEEEPFRMDNWCVVFDKDLKDLIKEEE